ncbi:MAG: DUF5069 domain-containing protein [Verrucomicrobiota bacterium]
MNHYNYQTSLKQIWTDAVAKYEAGNREPENYFDEDTLADLASVGLNTMDVYDYAEDYVSGGEPDFETFLMVCEARRDYFFTEQKGELSSNRLDSLTLPAKSEAIEGIVWLPRIMPKALAKLRGELPPETMYGCGGDRRFFKENSIHPAEFLRASWAYQDEPERLIKWVLARRSES